jgi:hypothetical protein
VETRNCLNAASKLAHADATVNRRRAALSTDFRDDRYGTRVELHMAMEGILSTPGCRWRRWICLSAFLFLVSSVFAQDNSKTNGKDAPVTALEIVVTGGPKNTPIDNASVYLRWQEPRGQWRHSKEVEFDLKTNLAGIAKVKDVPRKKIIIQVIKDGWKPFGQYYDLDKDQERIEIKLETPPHWY